MKNITATICLTIAVLLGSAEVSAQTTNDNEIATLYRSSVVIKNARILIATFNADINSRGGPFAYNWENCQIAATLFQNQGGVKTQFWCEKGPYKK